MKKQETLIQKTAISFRKALKSFSFSLPILLGIIILVGIIQVYLTKEMISNIFSGSIIDYFSASLLGSVLAGNPVTSYILGGELLSQGISLGAITAFLVSWVTVGMIQLPAEMLMLGKKYSITRNVLAFFSAILVALITVGVMSLI